MTDPSALLSTLSSQVEAGDLAGGRKTLASLKLALLDAPADEAASAAASSALELGVLLSAAGGDLEAFARNVLQLRPLYAAAAAAGGAGAASARRNHVLGLSLMHLLVGQRLAEFHSELELLSDAEAASPEVSFPIQLERQLMVGAYDEVLASSDRSPHPPTYGPFLDHLLQAVRSSIADGLEAAYETLPVGTACRMLKLADLDGLREYVEELREDWILEGDVVCFVPPESGRRAEDIPADTLIAQTLSYAAELERIV
jgi:26S proteasome regulatory subunit N12